MTPGIINNSQSLAGEEFIGAPVSAKPLLPKVKFSPASSALHADNGNTGSVDYPGPLGHDLNIASLEIQLGLFYWDDEGTMYGVFTGPCDGNETNIVQAIGVIDPDTLAFEATWEVPYAEAQLNTAYMQVIMETGQIVVNSAQGQIFVLEKCRDTNGTLTIDVRRTIDLRASGVLDGYSLLNSMMDAAGNIWFSTGAIDSVGSGEATTDSVVGYVEQDGTVHSLHIPKQSVGQGIAVSNTTVFVNCQPSSADDGTSAVGFLLALQPGSDSSVHVAWNGTYDAGSRRKLGASARGSGTTPSLLGNDFIVIADNTDVQINLLVFRQNATGTDVQPVCKAPLWQPNESWTDNGPLVHFDGKNYGVVLENLYNQPAFDTGNQTINGPYNNLTVMPPGLTKVFVSGDGSECHTEWTNPGRTTTVPFLSTKTGLIYSYEQSPELAYEGEYVWYATAVDYETGKTAWKARTGAGGIYNNQFRTTFLNPDGTLYQMVQGGVVMVRDGE